MEPKSASEFGPTAATLGQVGSLTVAVKPLVFGDQSGSALPNFWSKAKVGERALPDRVQP